MRDGDSPLCHQPCSRRHLGGRITRGADWKWGCRASPPPPPGSFWSRRRGRGPRRVRVYPAALGIPVRGPYVSAREHREPLEAGALMRLSVFVRTGEASCCDKQPRTLTRNAAKLTLIRASWFNGGSRGPSVRWLGAPGAVVSRGLAVPCRWPSCQMAGEGAVVTSLPLPPRWPAQSSSRRGVGEILLSCVSRERKPIW